MGNGDNNEHRRYIQLLKAHHFFFFFNLLDICFAVMEAAMAAWIFQLEMCSDWWTQI